MDEDTGVPYLNDKPYSIKRYLLFTTNHIGNYSGGWDDFKGHFDYEHLAIKFGTEHNYRHFHVVDTDKMKEIYRI